MNKQYILNKVKPYLNNDCMISEDNYNKLFSGLNKQQQYEIINILIEADIDIDYENVNTKALNNARKSLSSCFNIGVLNKLTNEQLCVIFQKGDNLALDAIIKNNMKLVWSRVLKYNRKYKHKLDDEDLVQYGIMGLILAVKRFDLKRGVKFTTYAIWWVDQQIIRGIINHGFTIRIPAHCFGLMNRLARILALNPTYTKLQIFELVKEDGIDRKKYEEILMVMENIMSLASLNVYLSDEDGNELGNFVIDEVSPSVEEQVELLTLKDTIECVLRGLTPREKDIIEQRFGLKDGIEKTLEEVSIKYNVTKERIRQIEVKALRKLRHTSSSEKLCDFVRGEVY